MLDKRADISAPSSRCQGDRPSPFFFSLDFWKRTPLAAKYASVVKEFLDCDVFVNLPIIKHHVGVGMSGNLKNLMGVNSNASNQFFHSGSGAKGEYDDVPFRGQRDH